METANYDVKPATKQFCSDTGSTAYSTTEGNLTRSPRILNRLSKLSKTDRQYAQVANILRCYVEAPSIVSKNTLEMENESRHKAKYHNTHSLSNSSRHNSFSGSDNSKSLPGHAKLKNERQLSFNFDSYPENSVKWNSTSTFPIINDRKQPHTTESRYSTCDPIVSARSVWPLPSFTDGYFDSLDIPGHFNTRGVYGQKANMSPFTMRRSSTELFLSNFHSRSGSFERQAVSLKWKLRRRERTSYELNNSKKFQHQGFNKTNKKIRRKSIKGKMQGALSHLPLHEENVQTKGQKAKDTKVLNLNVKLNEMFDGVSALKVSEPVANARPKRISVDVSVQTDIVTDDENDYFCF